MVFILHPTEAGPEKAFGKIAWVLMRLALKITSRKLRNYWNYAPVRPFDGTHLYRSITWGIHKGKSLAMLNLGLMRDTRNLSVDWLTFRATLTPLMGTEKKTVSGFDTRLVDVKSPKKIKNSRMRGVVFQPAGALHKSLRGLNRFNLSLSNGPGWGSKSSKALYFEGRSSYSTFKKRSSLGFLRAEPLPSQLLFDNNEGLLGLEEDSGSLPLRDLSLLVSVETNCQRTHFSERTFLFKVPLNPNALPELSPPSVEVETLNGDFVEFLDWSMALEEARESDLPFTRALLFKWFSSKNLIVFNV